MAGMATAAPRLHGSVDALAVAGQAGAEALAGVLAQAVAGLELQGRISLALRLRDLLHEAIAEAARQSPGDLGRWEGFLEKAEAAAPPVATPPSCGLGPCGWGRVLHFAVSLEALGKGLHAVSREWRRLALQPACWRGHDVTLHERHFAGLASSTLSGGSAVWGKAFGLLPLLREARTLRLAGFEDLGLRLRVLQPLREARRALCPGARLLACSFCERHRGEHIEFPSPRKLGAARRPVRDRGGGILIGNGHLARRADGKRSFTICVEQISLMERLDIGVTALAPHEHFRDNLSTTHGHVSFAEDLLKSWVIESSGLLVGSHTGLRIRDSRWDARQLTTGDHVELCVHDGGELGLSVNGRQVASWRAQIPSDAPIYPVVDLFEGSPRVRLLPSEEPP